MLLAKAMGNACQASLKTEAAPLPEVRSAPFWKRG